MKKIQIVSLLVFLGTTAVHAAAEAELNLEVGGPAKSGASVPVQAESASLAQNLSEEEQKSLAARVPNHPKSKPESFLEKQLNKACEERDEARRERSQAWIEKLTARKERDEARAETRQAGPAGSGIPPVLRGRPVARRVRWPGQTEEAAATRGCFGRPGPVRQPAPR